MWAGPWGPYTEAGRKLTLRLASDAARWRAVGTVRISEMIPRGRGRATSIIHNVLDEGFETAQIDSQQLEPDLADSMVCIGSIWSYRNLRRLIEAFALYRSRGGTLRLRIYGPGHRVMRSRLESETADLDWVSAPNHILSRSEAIAYMRSSRATIFPALVEASSIALLEALAIGATTVVSRIPGHTGLMDRVEGHSLSFDPLDVREIAEQLRLAESVSDPQPAPRLLATVGARSALRIEWARLLATNVSEIVRYLNMERGI
jgi:glycosyltransferase involved in cell wall biosynthesis